MMVLQKQNIVARQNFRLGKPYQVSSESFAWFHYCYLRTKRYGHIDMNYNDSKNIWTYG